MQNQRLSTTSGLAGSIAVGGSAHEDARPGILRRLFRGIGDGTRSRNTAADLRRIRL